MKRLPENKKYKPKKCKVCGDKFRPFQTTQKVCCLECAREFVKDQAKKEWKKKERKELKEAKEKIKTRGQWIKEAQKEFNAYIRARDTGKPCVSCNAPEHEVEAAQKWKTGGAWDCGHYLSVGSHPELRFEESNAARQCKSCNGGAGNYTRKNWQTQMDYRTNLISRIGADAVYSLEGPHEPKKYTIEELKLIKEKYKRKLREIKK